MINSGKCTKCGEILVSVHRHDFRTCRCDESFIDGGFDYRRCGGSIVPFKNPCFVFSTQQGEIIKIIKNGNLKKCVFIFKNQSGVVNVIEGISITPRFLENCLLIDAWEEV